MRHCVLIPARNEGLVLGSTLKSLLASIAPEDIYVINDGSTDDTGIIAASSKVAILTNEVNIGKAASVRRATLHFELTRRYDLISMMDADTVVSPGYFEQVQKAFEKQPDAAAVCGRVKGRRHNWITAYRELQYFLADTVFKAGQHEMGVITVAPGCSTTYRADVFEKLEWSTDTVTEDMDVTVQVHHNNLGRIVYEGSAKVLTQDPLTLSDYVKQMRRWNTGAWQIGRKHRMWGGRKKVDLEFQLLMTEGLIFALLFWLSPIWLVMHSKAAYLLLIDMAFTTASSLICAVRERRYDVFWYSPLYPVLRIVDSIVFLKTFFLVVVLNKPNMHWASLKRYVVLGEEK